MKNLSTRYFVFIWSLTLLFTSFIITSCSTNRKVLCERSEDGRTFTETVFVPKHPERLYAETEKEHKIIVSGAVDVLNKVAANVNLEIQTEVIELRDKLQQNAIVIQDVLKSSYATIVLHPCDKEALKLHQELNERIIREQAAIQKLQIATSALLNDSVISTDEIEVLERAISQFENESPGTFVPEERKEVKKLGYYFDKEVNGMERFNTAENNVAYRKDKGFGYSYSDFLMKEIDLSADYEVELKLRMLNLEEENSDYTGYGVFFNWGSMNEEYLFLLEFPPSDDSDELCTLSVLKYKDMEDCCDLVVLEKQIKRLKTNEFHTLRFQKSGENFTFFVDSQELGTTNQIRIDQKVVRVMISESADVLCDYIQYGYPIQVVKFD